MGATRDPLHHANAWPLVEEPADEWAGDEWLPDLPSSFASYQWGGGEASEAQHDAWDQRFFRFYTAALRGDPQLPELLEVADALGLRQPRRHDQRPPKVAPRVCTDRLLCDLVEDYLPDASMTAGDRFLGAWADQRPERPLLAAVTASLAGLPLLDGDGSVAQRFYNAKPRPPVALRTAARAALQAPAMLWTMDWRPLLPLKGWWVPDSDDIIHTPTRLGAGGAGRLARAYPTEHGWAAISVIELPVLPPLAPLMWRLELEYMRLRRHERRATWEDLLRRRPEPLYRSAAQWAWMETNE